MSKDGTVTQVWAEDGVPSYVIGDQGPQPEKVPPAVPWQPRELSPEERSGLSMLSDEHRGEIRR